MTGGGRCKRRRKEAAGGRFTAAKDEQNETPNLGPEITEKPSDSSEITKLPHRGVELDLYSLALKTLSFSSPFDSEESSASQTVISGPNSLPSRVSGLLGRHSDYKNRHKRVHFGLESKKKKSSAPSKPKGGIIWVETEDYFRELTAEDIQLIKRLGYNRHLSEDKCFHIPSLADDRHERYEEFNAKLVDGCGATCLKLEDGVSPDCNGKCEVDGGAVEEDDGPRAMDVDGDEPEAKEAELKEECNVEISRNPGEGTKSFSGVEWLLGSKNKIYLTSERPSKKRKLVGRDAGLEKLIVARPVDGLDSVCHYCSFSDVSNPLNCLIRCSSCGMVVHQRCYGVQDDVDSSWLCSWCKWKIATTSTSESPCLLCPKQGGALKPVQGRGRKNENDVSNVKFSHLFCCQWKPEVYVENIRTMEPVLNMDAVKDTRKKLTCYLCKVKWGACVQCSNGSCRTTFHPICAREASNRMEIWGKLGCDEIELRAFCSKHSEVHCDDGGQEGGDISPTGDLDSSKPNDSESHLQCGDALHSADRVEGNDSDINTCNSIVILKKLIGLGKVNAADVASDIGVSPDLLNSLVADNSADHELQDKLFAWLKDHDYINCLQTLKANIRFPTSPRNGVEAEGVGAVSVVESVAVPVKSVPPRRRTKSGIQFTKHNNSCSSKEKFIDNTADGDLDSCLRVREDSNGLSEEPLASADNKVEVDPGDRHYSSANDSIQNEAETQSLSQCLSKDGVVGESRQQTLQTAPQSPSQKSKKSSPTSSYIHPFIYSKLLRNRNDACERTLAQNFGCLIDGDGASYQLEAYSNAGSCSSNSHDLQANPSDMISQHDDGVNLDQLVKASNLVMLKLSPADEVEGELIYHQQRLLSNALARKHITDNLISKVVQNLPREIDMEVQRKWDTVLVTQYNNELREARKQGRKERRHKEAQAILAAATAAAASSSRISSIRKDALDGYPSHEINLRANAISGSAVTRLSSESEFPKDNRRTCDVCRRLETNLNPVLVCSSCKVAVHLDCYRSVKSSTGPWRCELCEDLLSSQDSRTIVSDSSERPHFVAECTLCGQTEGAFRKSVDGRWIHAFCAEWVLESTYKRGQVTNIDALVTDNMGTDTCVVCRCKLGVCLKCSYGHCHSMFHPTCARNAGFYMTLRTNAGKLQHKAYCERHSVEQRAKADSQKHGVEEFKSLKQVRVELERLRLLCERIIKREKLKRELVLCSHDILACKRDSLLSTTTRRPYYQPEISSDSATTSNRGYTDSYRSGSEMMVQRSDDITVDSTVAGKRHATVPNSQDSDQKAHNTSAMQNLKPGERVPFSGKQIPRRTSQRNLANDADKQSQINGKES